MHIPTFNKITTLLECCCVTFVTCTQGCVQLIMGLGNGKTCTLVASLLVPTLVCSIQGTTRKQCDSLKFSLQQPLTA